MSEYLNNITDAQMREKLTQREESILKLRFGLESTPQTLEEVGRGLGITRERVRQVEARALRKMRGEKGDMRRGQIFFEA